MESIGSTFHAFLGGRKALITGGTSGIGAAIGRALAAAGAKVTVTGVTDREVAAARAAPEMAGIEARPLNVRDDSAVKATVNGFDRLDLLVNCAGTIRRGAEHDPEVFEQVIDINLTGTMRCCSAARPLLAKTGGAIVNIASMLSFFGGGLVPGYSASKGGVAQLTKSLAIAYAADTIRVNAVARGHVSDRIARMRGARPSHASRTRIAPRLPGRHGPGWIATPLTESLQQDTARSQAILDRTPMKRWGRPEDVAGAVLFLCSPAAAFITGTILPVDGGYLTA